LKGGVPRPTPEHSVDRIDPNGNYEKGNIRWATRDVQSMNKRGQWYVRVEEQISEPWDDDYTSAPGFTRYKMIATWLRPVNCS